MDTLPDNTPPDWSEILAESEAELAAGRSVPGEMFHFELRESIARLEATNRREATKPR